MDYTKGEWKTDAEITDDVTVYCEQKPNRFLTIATIKAKPNDKERRANAYLISAAPAMYEALKVAQIELATNRNRTQLIRSALLKVEQALAKAKGKE